jgi:hypothetical protein
MYNTLMVAILVLVAIGTSTGTPYIALGLIQASALYPLLFDQF